MAAVTGAGQSRAHMWGQHRAGLEETPRESTVHIVGRTHRVTVSADFRTPKWVQGGTDFLKSIFVNDGKSPTLICEITQTHRAMA